MIRLIKAIYRLSGKISKYLFILWLLSIGVFVITVIIGNSKIDKFGGYPAYIGVSFLIEILLGVVFFGLAFLFGLLSLARKKPKEQDKIQRARLVEKLFVGFLILSILLAGGVIYSKYFPGKYNSAIEQIGIFPTPTPTLAPEQIKDQIINLVNQEREKNGLKPLIENKYLNQSAAAKAKDMLDRKYWSHNSPEGTEPWQFFKQSGYPFSYAGENQAKIFTNSNAVVDSWMNSPTHKENILSSKFTETGVGVIIIPGSVFDGTSFNQESPLNKTQNLLRGSQIKTWLIVQHFGAPPIVYAAYSIKPPNKVPSRTGRIMQYHDWCNNKGISVYENEIIVQKSSDGNVYGMTRDDWDCYEDTLKNRQ